MIRNIYKILPFFIVEWLGKKYGEPTNINGHKAFIVFNNTYILEKWVIIKQKSHTMIWVWKNKRAGTCSKIIEYNFISLGEVVDDLRQIMTDKN